MSTIFLLVQMLFWFKFQNLNKYFGTDKNIKKYCHILLFILSQNVHYGNIMPQEGMQLPCLST